MASHCPFNFTDDIFGVSFHMLICHLYICGEVSDKVFGPFFLFLA